MVSQLAGEISGKGFNIASKEWTTTIFYASTSTPLQTVRMPAAWYGATSASGVPIPAGAFASTDDDHEMTIVDRARNCIYDFGRAIENPDGSWGGYVNGMSLDGNGVYPLGNSPSGSGFSYAAGKILPGELAAGRIDHALTFTMNATKAGGAVAPATSSDGRSTLPGAIPEGARVRLDPSVDLETLGLNAWQKTIARALQVYGMFLYDTGGAVAIAAQQADSATEPYPWGSTGTPQLPPSLGSHLQVLTLGQQSPNVYQYVPSSCITFNR
jgi:hypothetical protein